MLCSCSQSKYETFAMLRLLDLCCISRPPQYCLSKPRTRLRPSTTDLPRGPCAARCRLDSAHGEPDWACPPPPAAFDGRARPPPSASATTTAVRVPDDGLFWVRFGAFEAARASSILDLGDRKSVV